MRVVRAVLLLVDSRVKDVSRSVLVDLFLDDGFADWWLLAESDEIVTYIVDVFVANIVHHIDQFAFVLRDSMLDQTQSALYDVQLIHDFLERLLDFWPQLAVGRTNLGVPKARLLAW